MTSSSKEFRVTMIREDLDGIPQFELPEGFSLRMYRPGDEADWLAVHRQADRYDEHIDYSLETFEGEFARDVEALSRRQYYLCQAAGRAIGTATAWLDSNYRGKVYGRVHWVAIVPEFQGRGLAKPLLTAVCNRLGELGHVRACLGTYSARTPAINLYLKFGFVPEINSQQDLEAWRLVRGRLPDSPLRGMDLVVP